MKECETLENVETWLVTGTGFLRHALHYGQMRCHFRIFEPLATKPRKEGQERITFFMVQDGIFLAELPRFKTPFVLLLVRDDPVEYFGYYTWLKDETQGAILTLIRVRNLPA